MNNEIKEILNNFEKYEVRYKLQNETQFVITHREIQILLDYITNLQQLEQEHKKINGELREENNKLEIALQNIQEDYNKRIKENERLNEYYDLMVQFNQKNLDRFCDYKSRCEKGIEYINTHKVSDTITFPLMKREQENQVKSCFDYEFEQAYKKDLLNILQNGDDSQ